MKGESAAIDAWRQKSVIPRIMSLVAEVGRWGRMGHGRVRMMDMSEVSYE